ncbi:MAG TPA: YbhB/YbcL family Raf kinase inhibitor-like protein [Xanthomonadaceae bacterium]|nr:YbhB/YbcL family Raf kinase inhibitor-like protein [Xanthomonadaceae bacterium]
MKLSSDSFPNRQPIPPRFAFGRIGAGSDPIALSDNRNPHLAWDEVPAATRSFALLCIDPDVPTEPDTVNRSDRTIPRDQPRAEFCHWVMVDLPARCRELAEGACADGVVARGKPEPAGPAGSRQGSNDYTGWFAQDPDMQGDYRGYDGPCPPFNDERMHRYFFRLFALDLERLPVGERFTGPDALRAMQGHVLAEAAIHGVYSLNPAVAKGG